MTGLKNWVTQLLKYKKANIRAIELMQELRAAYESDATPMVISGCMGREETGTILTAR